MARELNLSSRRNIALVSYSITIILVLLIVLEILPGLGTFCSSPAILGTYQAVGGGH
jgi:hypothetical protein